MVRVVLLQLLRGRSHRLEGELLRVEPGDKRIEPSRTIVSGGLTTCTYEDRTGTEDAEPVVPIQ